jgi:hypothetical protein
MSRIANSIEMESRLVVARKLGRGDRVEEQMKSGC